MAQPKPKFMELFDRYNEITRGSTYAEFRLHALARDAKAQFTKHSDPRAGLIWAACLFDVGKIYESEGVFDTLTRMVPPNPEDRVSIMLYLDYARLLCYTNRVNKAVLYLDIFLNVIMEHGRDLDDNGVSMYVYAEAEEYDKVKLLFDALMARQSDGSINIQVGWPMLAYFWHAGQKDNVISLMGDIARAIGYKDLAPDNLDAVLDALAQELLSPAFKKELSSSNRRQLQGIRIFVEEYFAAQEVLKQAAAPRRVMSMDVFKKASQDMASKNSWLYSELAK